MQRYETKHKQKPHQHCDKYYKHFATNGLYLGIWNFRRRGGWLYITIPRKSPKFYSLAPLALAATSGGFRWGRAQETRVSQRPRLTISMLFIFKLMSVYVPQNWETVMKTIVFPKSKPFSQETCVGVLTAFLCKVATVILCILPLEVKCKNVKR